MTWESHLKKFLKKYHDIWSKSLKEMNFQYDLYTHTHTENHMKIVKDIFQILLEKKTT